MSKIVVLLSILKEILGESKYNEFLTFYDVTTVGGYLLTKGKKVILRSNDMYDIIEYVYKNF